MKKRDIVNLIELNKKVLEGNRYKKIDIPVFDELKEELDILKEFNKNKDIINFLRSDPKRSVEYIVKKIK